MGTNVAAVVGGNSNQISGDRSFIGAGFQNAVNNNSIDSVIAGGRANRVANIIPGFGGANFSVIVGGEGNVIDSLQGPVTTHNAIVGGQSNTINAQSNHSFLGGGELNTVHGGWNSMGGGQNNSVVGVVTHSHIGGGNRNVVSSNNSAIGGGENNNISGGGFSFIGGGQNNTTTGAFSSILGGSGNSDGGFNNAHIIGSGIVLGAGVGNPGSLHVNNLWMAPATYNAFAGVAPPGTYPLGTIYVDTAANNTLRIQ